MITTNKIRIGSFSSSENYRLVGTDKVFNTYLIEKQDERLLGRSLDSEQSAQSLAWGKWMEPYAHVRVNGNFDYQLIGDITEAHPEYPYWVGSVDTLTEDSAGDIKCPYSVKSFMGLIRPALLGFNGIEAMNMLRNGFTHNGKKYDKHKDAEKYYWQIVSNACIHNKKFGELIVYMPYEDYLEEIKNDLDIDNDYYFIYINPVEKLPHLKRDGKANDLYVIRFEIPQEDKDLLESKVKQAGELLLK